jgi:hypothetical protein
VKKSNNIILIVVILVNLIGCTVVKDTNNSGGIIGDNSFIINAPNVSQKYEKTEIIQYISYHIILIKNIEDTISKVQSKKWKLQQDYNDGQIKYKEFEKQNKIYDKKLNDFEIQKKNAKDVLEKWKDLSSKSYKEDSIQTAELIKKKAETALKLADSLASIKSKIKLYNCYKTNFIKVDVLVLRSRPLTQPELVTCNQCLTYIQSDGINAKTIYEDLNKQSCKLKKKLDDETSVGFVQNELIVNLIETKGNFSKIEISNTGQIGWISSKYAQQPTLVKVQCP